MVADIASPGIRGAAFGLRQSLDTIGAFAGPLIAIALKFVLAGNIRAVFACSMVPAPLAVAVLIFAVKEPRRIDGVRHPRSPIRWIDARAMG